MTAPLTPEEIRKRRAVLAVHPEFRQRKGRQRKAPNISLGIVEWANPGPPEPGVVRRPPAERSAWLPPQGRMSAAERKRIEARLDGAEPLAKAEVRWVSEHQRGEKA